MSRVYRETVRGGWWAFRPPHEGSDGERSRFGFDFRVGRWEHVAALASLNATVQLALRFSEFDFRPMRGYLAIPHVSRQDEVEILVDELGRQQKVCGAGVRQREELAGRTDLRTGDEPEATLEP